jgi:hypothetical protein
VSPASEAHQAAQVAFDLQYKHAPIKWPMLEKFSKQDRIIKTMHIKIEE